MEKVELKQAKDEFKRWFDAKKLPEYLLEKKADDKDVIIAAIQSGNLVLNDENTFTQVLNFPIKDGQVAELTFAFRITEGELAAASKGLRPDDLIGQLPIAYVAALTSQNRGVIRAMDTVDLNVGKAIASFFSI